MAKKKKKKSRIIIILILLIIMILFGLLAIKFKPKKEKQPEEPQIEIIDSIDKFGYELNDNETKYYNELFDKLKDILKEEDYNEEEYATIIAQLFLADFYDLDTKIMKSDIGGTQFVYEPYREDFEKGALTSVYKYVESNVYKDRKQELPIVKKIERQDIKQDKFKYNDTQDINAYYLTMNIEYNKDLGYPTKVELVLIHNNDKLEIAKLEKKA